TKLSLRCSKTFRRRCIPEAGDIGAAPRRLHYGDGGRPQRGKSMVDQTVRVAPQAHGSEGRVPARVLIDGRCDEIWFDAPGVLWTQSANPFLAMTLLAAMATNHKLVVEGHVSPRLLQNIERVQEIFHCWSRRFQIVAVEGEPVVSREDPQKVACFF